MVLPMSYWKFSEREILQHYGAIADAISLPIMVYNNPATSGIDLLPKFIMQMAKAIPNVTMVKESTGDIQRMRTDCKSSPMALCGFTTALIR